MDSVAKASVSQIRRIPDSSLVIPDAEHFVKVPDGEYVAKFIGAEGSYYRGRTPKVALWFSIAEGDYSGERVAGFFNVRSLDCERGQRTREPHFTVGWRSDLTQAMATLYPEMFSPDILPTTIPEVEMVRSLIAIQTRTCESNHKGQTRPDAFRYTVIDMIIGWAE